MQKQSFYAVNFPRINCYCYLNTVLNGCATCIYNFIIKKANCRTKTELEAPDTELVTANTNFNMQYFKYKVPSAILQKHKTTSE